MPINEYDDLLQDAVVKDTGFEAEFDNIVKEETKTAVKQSLFVAKDKDLNTQAEAYQIAKRNRIPVEVVANNLDWFKKSENLNDDKIDSIVNESPKLAQWMSNPENAAFSKEDLDALANIEKSVNNSGFTNQAYNSLFGGIASINKRLAQTPAYIYELGALPQNLYYKFTEQQEKMIKAPEWLRNNIATQYYSESQKQFGELAPDLNKSVVGLADNGNYADAGKTLALQVINNAPQQVVNLTAALTGYSAIGLAATGLMTAAEKQAQTLEEGKADVLTSTYNAAAVGAIESAFESIGTFGVANKWASSLASKYGNETSKQIIFNYAKTIVHSAASEGNEEALTSIAQDLTDYMTGVNPDALKGIGQRAIEAGIVGAASGGVMTGPAAISASVQRHQEVMQAKANKEAFVAMANASKDSKLLEVLPDKMQEYVKEVTKNGDVENVYIKPEAFETFFQTKNINPAKAAADLGITKEYDEAKEAGTDVKVPMSTLIAKVSNQDLLDLSNDIKFNPDQKSHNELIGEADEAKRQLEEEKKAAETETEDTKREKSQAQQIYSELAEIRQTTKQRLIEQGVGERDASKNSLLLTENARVRSKQLGITPKEYLSRHGLAIGGKYIVEPAQVAGEKTGELYQRKDYSFDQETGDYTFGNVEANISIRSEDMLNDLSPKLAEITSGEALEINTLEVPSDEQGKGLGSKALKDIEQLAIEQGQEYVVLKAEPLSSPKAGEAKPSNLKKLIKFYEKNGFVVADKNKKQAFMYKKIEGKKEYFQQQGAPIGKTEIAGGYINVELLSGANRSTFLHEMGHAFVEMLNRDASLPDAPQQIKDDLQEILNYVGVKSYKEMRRKHHEKLAKAFEKYLHEGKAPSGSSKKLRKAFSLFRHWLNDVYKLLKDDELFPKITLTKEVTEVFDRMLVTEEEIEQASLKLDFKPIFDDPSIIGMSEADQYEYNDAIYWAKAEAKEILTKKLLEDVSKKQDRKYKNKYDALYEEEMKKAKEKQEFKALEQMKQDDFKLSRPVLDKYYKVFEGFYPKSITKEEGGVHPDFIAGIYGYENGQALLQAIAPYNRGIEHYVDAQVATKLKSEFPELLTSPDLAEEAIKAFHNENYKKLKKIELKYLSEKNPKLDKKIAAQLIKRMPSDKVVKEQAQRIVDKTVVNEIYPSKYRAAEKRMAKETASNYKKGEYALAFESKRRELLNFELYDAAYEAKEDVRIKIKDFKKIFKSDEDLAKTHDMNLVNAARAILSDYGVRRAEKTAAEYMAPLKQYDPELYNSTMVLVQEAVDAAKSYDELTYGEFKSLVDTVDALMELARSSREIEIDGKIMQKEQIKEQIFSQLNKFTKYSGPAGIQKTIDTYGEIKQELLDAVSSGIRVEYLVNTLDLGDSGAFRKYIWQPISDATAKYRIKKNEVITNYKDIIEKYKDIFTGEAIIADELNFSFRNKGELLMAVLHSGNESNLRKLIVGNNWGEVFEDGTYDKLKWNSFINRMQREGVLTKQDYDFAQSVWDLMESLKPDAQKAHKKMYGHYFNEITANEITTQFGTYKGGYIPAKVDGLRSMDGRQRQSVEEFEKDNKNYSFPTTGRGFTKSRVDSYADILSLNIDLLGSHIDSVLRFSIIEPRVKEVARLVVTDKQVTGELGRINPALGTEVFGKWLDRAATQKMVTQSTSRSGKMFDRAATFLRTTVGRALMSLNVKNTVEQYFGLIVSLAKVKPRHLRNAFVTYARNPGMTSEQVIEKSQYMKSTQGLNINEVYKSIDEILTNQDTFDKIKNFTNEHAYFMQQATQNMVNTIVWVGAYNQAIQSGSTETEAVRAADSAVRMTQGSGTPENASEMERDTAKALLFKQFLGYFNMLANLYSSSLIEIAKTTGLKKGAGKALYMHMVVMALPSIGSALLTIAASGEDFDQDDDDSYLDDLIDVVFGSQARTMIATVPYAKDLIGAFTGSFTKQRGDDRISMSPAISVLESTIGTPAQIYKSIIDDNYENKKTVKDVFMAMSVISGVPVYSVSKPVSYMMDVESGKARPTGPIDFTRGLVTGKAGE